MGEAGLNRKGSSKSRRFTIGCLSGAVKDLKPKDKPVAAWTSLKTLNPSLSKTQQNAEKQKTIALNVGGKVFHIPVKCVLKYPYTRIGSLVLCNDEKAVFKFCDDYSSLTKEFFFDRDPACFLYVRHFYMSGVLWIGPEMCPMSFEAEVDYWGLSLRDTQLCCWLVFEQKVGDVEDKLRVEQEILADGAVTCDDEHFKTMIFGSTRQRLWDIVENPYSSTYAKAFTLVSNLCVLISIVAIALDTVKELHIYKTNGKTHMQWVEIFTIIFFTFEYLIRLATTPSLKSFLSGSLNFVDLVAIVPYYVQIVFESMAGVENVDSRQDLKTMAHVSKLSHVLKVVKLLRIFRILKLARHSTGMRAVGFTLKQCYAEVFSIFLILGLSIFTFSALMHSVEKESESSAITSIPYAWWWAAVSISTVGYGDVVPVTILGRLVAFGCISFGIILNGLPISFLFNNFSDYYSKLKAQEYNVTTMQREFQLRKRLRRRFDFCFHPSECSPEEETNAT